MTLNVKFYLKYTFGTARIRMLWLSVRSGATKIGIFFFLHHHLSHAIYIIMTALDGFIIPQRQATLKLDRNSVGMVCNVRRLHWPHMSDAFLADLSCRYNTIIVTSVSVVPCKYSSATTSNCRL